MVSSFNSSVVGDQTITVTYGEFTTTFAVEVLSGEPESTVPVASFTTEFNATELLAAVQSAGCTFDTVLDGIGDTSVKIVGNSAANNSIEKMAADQTNLWLNVYAKTDFAWSAKGVKVDVFANENNVINRIVVTESFFDTIETKTADKTSTPLVDERAFTTAGGYTVTAEDAVEGFDEVYTSVREGEVLVIIPNEENSTALRVYVPTEVTGMVTYYKVGSSLSIDDVNYKMSRNYSGYVTAGDENVTLYLDEFGCAIGAEGGSTVAAPAVVLSTYNGINADGAIVSMAQVLYADGTTARVETGTMTGYYVSPVEGSIYLYDENDDGQTCFTAVPAASGTIDETYEGCTLAAAAQAVAESAKAITLGSSRNYFADGCRFIYISQDSDYNWSFMNSKKLQDIDSSTPLYAVIDDDGNISTLFILGVSAKCTIEDGSELIFIADYDGWCKKLDKNGRTVTLYLYDAYIDGVAIEGFSSEDALGGPCFVKKEYDADNGWYILSGNEYNDATEDIKVTEAESFSSGSLAAGKYITVDGSFDLELTSATKYVSTIEGEPVSGLAELKALVALGDYSATIYVVYDSETGVALNVYVTDGASFPVPSLPSGVASVVPVVVLNRYSGLNANGAIVDMAQILYADGTTARVATGTMTGYTVLPVSGSIYLTRTNDDGETCFAAIPAASGVVDETNAGETYAADGQAISESAKSIVLGSGRNYFADGCEFVYVYLNAEGFWQGKVTEKLQDIPASVPVYAVIDDDGNIATLFVMGMMAKNTIKDSNSLIFIAGVSGAASKLDKDGKLVSLVQYDAFINGEKVEGFVSEDYVSVGFYENEYDAENGWYILAGNAYIDDSEDIQVTGAECFDKDSVAVGKYIVVDGSVDVELTSDTKYASNIEDCDITSLETLQSAVINDGSSAEIYVVYDNETGNALYVYVVDGIDLNPVGDVKIPEIKESSESGFTLATEFNANELLAAAASLGFTFDIKADGTNDVSLSFVQNGWSSGTMTPAETKAWLTEYATVDFDWSGKGVRVDVLANADKIIEQLVVTESVMDFVDSKTEDRVGTPLVDERKIVTTNGYVICGSDGAEGFDELFDSIEEGDSVVIIPAAASGKVLKVYAPTEVLGGIVAYYKAGVCLTVDSTNYALSKNYSGTVCAGDEGVTLYFDEFGYVIGAEGSSATASSVVVLSTYTGLHADGYLVDMAQVLYADGTTASVETGTMTGFTATPTVGCIYLYDTNDDGQICFANAPIATGAYDENNEGETYTATITVTESAKSIALGNGRNFFADGCEFIYVSRNAEGEWQYTITDKLQDLTSASVAAVIDADGNISTLWVMGVAAKTTNKDGRSLIFIADTDGMASKLDKDGKAVMLQCYDAYIDGVKVEGFMSEDTVYVGFYENEYDTENGWYVLAGNAYNDAAEDIKVTGAETLTADTIYAGKYICVDGGIDVELTTDTKYASNIDDEEIGSLDELKDLLSYGYAADIYVVYNGETGEALCVYITCLTDSGSGPIETPEPPAEGTYAESLVVLDVYQENTIDILYVLYADGTTARVEAGTMEGFELAAVAGTAYLYDVNSSGQTCLATISSASTAITAADGGATYLLPVQYVLESTKSIASSGVGRSYFADGCKFLYVHSSGDEWEFDVTNKLQDMYLPSSSAAVVIDNEGNIAAMYILGIAANTAIKDGSSLIFIAEQTGSAAKLDKDGKLVYLYCYDAFINGEKVEGFVSEDSVTPGFYENVYDAENGWYVLSGYAYNDAAEDIKVTAAETFDKDSLHAGKYITVDSCVDVELTANTKYASNIDGIAIDSLGDLRYAVSKDMSYTIVYVVYDAEMCETLYVYVTAGSEIALTAEVSSIAITTLPAKLEYEAGKESIDVTGGRLTAYYTDGTTDEVDLIADMISGFDNTKLGTQTLTVTYGGKTAAYDVVLAAEPTISEISAISGNTVTISIENNEAGSCYVAVYSTDGQLLSYGLTPVSADAGEVTVSITPFTTTSQYTVKAFLVDTQGIPTCECATTE